MKRSSVRIGASSLDDGPDSFVTNAADETIASNQSNPADSTGDTVQIDPATNMPINEPTQGYATSRKKVAATTAAPKPTIMAPVKPASPGLFGVPTAVWLLGGIGGAVIVFRKHIGAAFRR